MGSNIFYPDDYFVIQKRLDHVNAESLRLWGTMSVAQMMEHCSMQLELGLGKIEQADFEGSWLMRTAFGRWLFLYALPWPKGIRTPTRMDMVKNNIYPDDFQFRKRNLFELLEQVRQSPGLKPHPFFGAMNKRVWGRLIWKHLDHHLRQFGC
ncbi:MAG: DUF1569 domain-containing protein [Bacteroidota bacterium]